jgi:hypothetical protein
LLASRQTLTMESPPCPRIRRTLIGTTANARLAADAGVQWRLAYDRMTAHIFGNRSQNSLPPHESTKPPASSKAFQNGSDERRIASAASVVTPRVDCMAAINSRRDSAAGRPERP